MPFSIEIIELCSYVLSYPGSPTEYVWLKDSVGPALKLKQA